MSRSERMDRKVDVDVDSVKESRATDSLSSGESVFFYVYAIKCETICLAYFFMK